jgi:hypothetical protein
LSFFKSTVACQIPSICRHAQSAGALRDWRKISSKLSGMRYKHVYWHKQVANDASAKDSLNMHEGGVERDGLRLSGERPGVVDQLPFSAVSVREDDQHMAIAASIREL